MTPDQNEVSHKEEFNLFYINKEMGYNILQILTKVKYFKI